MKVPPQGCFLPFDIKDYFMSGTHTALTQDSSSHMDHPLRSAFRKITHAVLRNQFVRVPNAGHRLWQVMCGSGMGMSCSGELSDMTFYNNVERDFLERESVRDRFNIIYYSRFKDDGIIIFSHFDACRIDELKWELMQRSAFFKLAFGDLNFERADFLDVSVFKGNGWKLTGFLDHCIFHKPTSIYQPLAFTSAHPYELATIFGRSDIQTLF